MAKSSKGKNNRVKTESSKGKNNRVKTESSKGKNSGVKTETQFAITAPVRHQANPKPNNMITVTVNDQNNNHQYHVTLFFYPNGPTGEIQDGNMAILPTMPGVYTTAMPVSPMGGNQRRIRVEDTNNGDSQSYWFQAGA